MHDAWDISFIHFNITALLSPVTYYTYWSNTKWTIPVWIQNITKFQTTFQHAVVFASALQLSEATTYILLGLQGHYTT